MKKAHQGQSLAMGHARGEGEDRWENSTFHCSLLKHGMGIITNFYNMTSPIGLFRNICSAAEGCNKKSFWGF